MKVVLKSAIIIFFSTVLFGSCHHLYKAGNLIALEYPIETRLRSNIIRQYLDTLIQKHSYGVPYKWAHYDKLVDLDSINNIRVYFKTGPEEMYLLSFGGMLELSDVYNPQINAYDWVSKRELLSKQEEERIMERLKHEILERIEIMAKEDGLADSTIYKE